MLLRSLKEITIEVAGISASLRLDDEKFFQELEKVYDGFRSDRIQDITMDVNLRDGLVGRENLPFGVFFAGDKVRISCDQFSGYMDLVNREGKVEIFSDYPLESLGNFLRNIYSILITKREGILLHASCVVKDGLAYIFLGPSGSGKSTVARLSNSWTVLSDDLVVIRQVHGRFKAFGTPYWGDMKHNNGINACFEIRGIFRLIQDKRVYLERLTGSEALAEVVAVPDCSWDDSLVSILFHKYFGLIGDTRCYRMHFLPDPSFWRCIDEEFAKKLSA